MFVSKTTQSVKAGDRPSTAARPMTSNMRRPATAAGGLLHRPGTAAFGGMAAFSDEQNAADTSSTLTHGSSVVFCGSPLKALKARRGMTGAVRV